MKKKVAKVIQICGVLALRVNQLFSSASWVWTEDVVGVALFLIQEKVSFSNSSVEDLVRVLQRSAEVLIKSSKFAKFMIELCKNIQLKQMVRYIYL